MENQSQSPYASFILRAMSITAHSLHAYRAKRLLSEFLQQEPLEDAGKLEWTLWWQTIKELRADYEYYVQYAPLHLIPFEDIPEYAGVQRAYNLVCAHVPELEEDSVEEEVEGETEMDDDAEESFEVAETSDPELPHPELVTFTNPFQEGRLFWPQTPNPRSSPVMDGEPTPAESAYIRQQRRMEERQLRALEMEDVTPARQEHPTRCMRRAEMENDEASFPQRGTTASGSRIRGHAGQQGGRVIDRMRRAGESMKGKKVITFADTSDVRVSTTTREGDISLAGDELGGYSQSSLEW